MVKSCLFIASSAVEGLSEMLGFLRKITGLSNEKSTKKPNFSFADY